MSFDLSYVNLALNVVAAIAVPIGLAIYRNLKLARDNELHQLQSDIRDVKSVLQTDVAELKRLVLDHLSWHSQERKQ